MITFFQTFYWLDTQWRPHFRPFTDSTQGVDFVSDLLLTWYTIGDFVLDLLLTWHILVTLFLTFYCFSDLTHSGDLISDCILTWHTVVTSFQTMYWLDTQWWPCFRPFADLTHIGDLVSDLLLTWHTLVTLFQTWRTPSRTRRLQASPLKNGKASASCWTVVSLTHSVPCTLTKRRSTPSGPTLDRPGRRTLDGEYLFTHHGNILQIMIRDLLYK